MELHRERSVSAACAAGLYLNYEAAFNVSQPARQKAIRLLLDKGHKLKRYISQLVNFLKGQTLPVIKNYFDIDIRYRYFKL